jgi:hypothetical protein
MAGPSVLTHRSQLTEPHIQPESRGRNKEGLSLFHVFVCLCGDKDWEKLNYFLTVTLLILFSPSLCQPFPVYVTLAFCPSTLKIPWRPKQSLHSPDQPWDDAGTASIYIEAPLPKAHIFIYLDAYTHSPIYIYTYTHYNLMLTQTHMPIPLQMHHIKTHPYSHMMEISIQALSNSQYWP